MVQDRFRIDAAGGVDRAHIRQQRPEFVERAEIGRRPSQDIDEGLLGVLSPVERAKQHRALDLGIAGIDLDAATRDQILKLSQPRFLRQTGSPAGMLPAASRETIAFCFSPVTMRGSMSVAFKRATIC